MADKPLEGKVALVTGAGSSMGMGREMALALAEAGARVALMDIDADQLERNANDAREVGGDGCALPIVGSVNSWDDAQRAVSETIAGLGGLHIVINNAGVPSRRPGGFWELPPEEWIHALSVNTNGPFLMARAAVNHMREQGWGRIIGVTTSLDTMIRNLPTARPSPRTSRSSPSSRSSSTAPASPRTSSSPAGPRTPISSRTPTCATATPSSSRT